ncbi:MAG: pyridoxamine 5'-phosphate oxidase family protein [Desulfobacteraceae bacterium]|jgi:nitroimidazol reductase NimA-like FMN-containing flavoprotein (pyridoxamine 5'-phosphate oxidase superfamily)
MFRKIRRKEKQLTAEECNEILTKAEYGTLATMGADGYPYAVPVNYVFHNGNIFFHSATVGHKLENIDYCSNVSFSVVTDVWVMPLIPDKDVNENDLKFNGFDTNFNSVIIFGKAKEVFEEEKMDGLCALLKRFLNKDEYSKYKEAGIKYIERSLKRTKLIKIEIEHMTGKRGIRENTQIQGKQH